MTVIEITPAPAETDHIIEHDFRNELGQRVIVLTCMAQRRTAVATNDIRCTLCGK